MSEKKIHLISGDDWTALYIDGVKVCENHILRAKDVLNALANAGVLSYTREYFDDEDMPFPEELNPAPSQE